MRVLCHRGCWKRPEERNTVEAFSRAFALGLGTETDVRDRDGELVISHDCAKAGALSLQAYLQLVARHDGANRPGTTASPSLTQALNVKADGLAGAIASAMKGFAHPWFVFDMSIPDTLQQLKAGNPVFARMSEFEDRPTRIEGRIRGIWLDAFESTWYSTPTISSLLASGLEVAVVSPELHGRPDHLALWAALRALRHEQRLMLCTDRPEEALQALDLAAP